MDGLTLVLYIIHISCLKKCKQHCVMAGGIEKVFNFQATKLMENKLILQAKLNMWKVT